jgi:hypothetical protein
MVSTTLKPLLEGSLRASRLISYQVVS